MSNKLYKFYWDYGRSGTVTGLFVADSEEVEKAIGERVYFGEILGKHSEVYGDLEEGDITLVSENPEVIKVFIDEEISSGYNPLDYLQGDDE